MSLDNSKYDHWILHKKLVLDETFTVIHISIHISLNIGAIIPNLHIPENPFPLAGALDGGSPMSPVDFKKWQCPLSLF